MGRIAEQVRRCDSKPSFANRAEPLVAWFGLVMQFECSLLTDWSVVLAVLFVRVSDTMRWSLSE